MADRESAGCMIVVESISIQDHFPVDEEPLRRAAEAVLRGEGLELANLSLVVVDDRRIHELNRDFLGHDYPTDCISFVFDPPPSLEGEVVVSIDTADAQGPQHGWSRDDELLLYVIHGTLHLVGYDDLEPEAARVMRQREAHYLELLGRRPAVGTPQHRALAREG